MSKKQQTDQVPPLPDEQHIVRLLRRRLRMVVIAAVLLALLALALAIALVATPLSEQILPGHDSAGDQTITNPDARLAKFYRPEVLYWRDEILGWAQEYSVNPNVIAIVIQIESCGGPSAISSAGATGLMQVMPFHFENGENLLNPDTNVQRGMTVFYECLTVFADWDLGLALACYNGGPRVTQVDSAYWYEETRAYYRWATGLWEDVTEGNESSDTLEQWLAAGGLRLCEETAAYLFPAEDEEK
ncbi:MAG: lytic transglycosylase domain-containing protein [Anaerolineae bacterium]|nr:lytic transglycosylase domain-containing protein [Anaerolineae bacterium]